MWAFASVSHHHEDESSNGELLQLLDEVRELVPLLKENLKASPVTQTNNVEVSGHSAHDELVREVLVTRGHIQPGD